ncbi:MAG TPA: FHA domain-containing protein [Pirellulales bacterium]|nr:FHA domain-containing protein [Pirellulales bacterium]
MAVILQVTGGPAVGRKTFLRAGQLMHVGRTERSDFSIPQDGAMAPVHFALEFTANICRIRDLTSGVGTLVNGQPVADGIVSHGDRISAGATTFSVYIEGNSTAAPATGAAAVSAAAAPPTSATLSSGFVHVAVPLAAGVCEKLELDEGAQSLLEPQQTVRQFFVLLGKKQLHADAMRLLAHALPKREAIWWAAQCVRAAFGDQLPLADRAALGAAEGWVVEPTEENRRRTESAAEATKHETAAGWAAAGAFWSGGSIAPPGLPDVPPKETLTAQAAVVAISMSAASDPKKSAARNAEFLAIGARVADGEVRWKAQ